MLSRATDRASGPAAVLPLLLLCLSLRAMIPAGWMPMADAHGMVMQPCRGWQAMAPLDAKAMHVSLFDAANGAGSHHPPASSRDGSQDYPCAFAFVSGDVPSNAAAGVAIVDVHPAAMVLPPPASIEPGIAAPPPFSTGPPLRA